ncbi:MAG: HEAT repeat domain-containing protein [Deltaproteobacteria bacterium]|nr:HEAT repeat domain-containing protein [Deltaproteobacteria bacterium]
MMLRKIFTPLFSALIILFFLSAAADAGRDTARDLAAAQDRSRSVEDRLRAISTMGQSGDERHSESLLRMLRDKGENRRVRTGAVMSLAKLGKPRPKIIEAYEEVYRDRKTGENLRYAILLSLGTLKATESQTLLAEALSGGDDRIRFKAAQALGMIGGNDAVNLLASRLDLERDRMVRAEIVRALGRSESAFVEGILARALKTDPEPLVRYNAALSLVQFKSLSTEGREALRAAGEDPSPIVRKTVREAGR